MGLLSSIPHLPSLVFVEHTQIYSNPLTATEDTACDRLISADREFVRVQVTVSRWVEGYMLSLRGCPLGKDPLNF